MPNLSRLNDSDQGRRRIQRGAKTVFCNGIPVGLHESQLIGGFRDGRSQEGSPTVFAENCPVLRIGSSTTNSTIIEGSPNVFCQ